jgi:hypothetical protein
MAIEKKLIHFGKLADFEAQLNAGNILDYSIVFIQDAKKIWTHGSYYDCSGAGDKGKYYLARFSFSDLQTGDGVQNAGKSELIQAIRNGAMIFLPYVSDMPEYGYIFAQAFVEDLLYMTVSSLSYQYIISTPIDTEDIAASEIEEIIIQDRLVSGQNIKTINGESILGSGDIAIEGGTTLTESDIAAMGFTKNTGTYSKPSGGIPKNDLASDVQSALVAAEAYKGTVSNIKINGSTKAPTNGVLDLGTVGTYNKPSTGIPKSDLASDVQRALDNANNAVARDTFEELEIIQIQGFEGSLNGVVYALPSETTGDEDDVIATRGTLKTINGESIFGSGDITISGSGSSSSSVAAYRVIEHGTNDTTTMISPNAFHVWGEVPSLTIIFGGGPAAYANEYLFQFTSGSTATTLSLPDDIKWANDYAPTISVNKIYQISVLRGLASCLEFNNATALIENLCTYDGLKTVTFQYPVASDVEVEVAGNTVTVTTGNISGSMSGIGEPMGTITAIHPSSDNTYIYIY